MSFVFSLGLTYYSDTKIKLYFVYYSHLVGWLPSPGTAVSVRGLCKYMYTAYKYIELVTR